MTMITRTPWYSDLDVGCSNRLPYACGVYGIAGGRFNPADRPARAIFN
jgi:hypothetical protein